ncbi:MAG: 8-oxo-dGTP diphosphatase [Phormidesmis priestleyi Ana]|uniref:8-oxo-dGTP diphosphatase n=1 Tax=Phormidesmis priestleyi Ana TaxID=1666911 RepID=A0A0P7ZQG6_9CYAN|nr:MAG: 8-oxo-dGTP diphosphatase [Phormidesmis priestleyi Ana]
MAKIFNPLQKLRPVRTLLGLLLRRPIVGTSIIPLLPDGRIVLIRRRDDGLWALPGGIVDWDEDITTAATRELMEETGLMLTAVGRLVGVYSARNRDPRFHSICVALEAQVEGSFKIFDKAEVIEVQAFEQEALPTGTLAHDHAAQLNDYFVGKTVLA